MDIQIPSSLERLIFDLQGETGGFYDNLSSSNSSTLNIDAIAKLQSIFKSKTYLDSDIEHNITNLFARFGVIFDPHSVTSINMALEHNSNLPTVAIATASTEKFSNVISPLLAEAKNISIDGKEEFKECSSEIQGVVNTISAYFI